MIRRRAAYLAILAAMVFCGYAAATVPPGGVSLMCVLAIVNGVAALLALRMHFRGEDAERRYAEAADLIIHDHMAWQRSVAGLR